MKKSDLGAIILIAGFSTLVAFLLGNAIFGDPNEEEVKVQYMDVISGDVAQPSQELFNYWAINPTVEVYVGACSNNETWNIELKQCISNDQPTTPSSDDASDETPDETDDTSQPTPEE